MAGLDVRRRVAVVDPFQPVSCDLPSRLVHCRDRFAVARHRRRDCIDGDGRGALGEHAMQSPEAGARAVFVNGFHVHVAHAGPGRCADDFGEEGFRGRIAVQDVVFAALLVVDDELHRHARVLKANQRKAACARSRSCRADSFHRPSSPCIPRLRLKRPPPDATTGMSFAPARQMLQKGSSKSFPASEKPQRPDISLQFEPPFARIVLNRPERRNAISRAMWRALVAIYRR